MTIYNALQSKRIHTTHVYLDIVTCDAIADELHYIYSDGDKFCNSLDVFLSYHSTSIQSQHSDIVVAFPEYFI